MRPRPHQFFRCCDTERADELAVDYVEALRRHFRIVLRHIIGPLALQAMAATALLTIGGWLVIQGQLRSASS